jgi:hypothetical protein
MPCSVAPIDRRNRAEQALRDAQRELEVAIRAAHASGESLSAIGRVAGVSRQRVAQIVGRRA